MISSPDRPAANGLSSDRCWRRDSAYWPDCRRPHWRTPASRRRAPRDWRPCPFRRCTAISPAVPSIAALQYEIRRTPGKSFCSQLRNVLKPLCTKFNINIIIYAFTIRLGLKFGTQDFWAGPAAAGGRKNVMLRFSVCVGKLLARCEHMCGSFHAYVCGSDFHSLTPCLPLARSRCEILLKSQALFRP